MQNIAQDASNDKEGPPDWLHTERIWQVVHGTWCDAAQGEKGYLSLNSWPCSQMEMVEVGTGSVQVSLTDSTNKVVGDNEEKQTLFLYVRD